MSRNPDPEYLPLENIESNLNDDIIEVLEENDQEPLVPKSNNTAQLEIEEAEDENDNIIGVVVNEDNANASSSTSENIQNPFLPSTSNPSAAPQNNTLKSKLKNSFLSEFRFFRKTPKPKKPYIVQSHDGVFSNLNEKPEIRSDALPTYSQVTGEAEFDPFYGYEVAYCHIGEFYGEMLINNIPAGTWAGLVLSAFFSSIFDFIGFIMTFFLSTSHGTRKGALIGLAITLIRYGVIIMSGNVSLDSPTDDELEYNGINGLADYWWFGKWVGLVMIAIAIFIIYHSISRFKRILKVKDYAEKHPDRVPEFNI